MLSSALRSVWDEPRAPDPPRRVWRDWVLVGLLLTATVLEGVFRTDVVWRPVAMVVSVGLVLTMLWRRTHPLEMVVAAFGTWIVVDALALAFADAAVGLDSSACSLILAYSLTRWGSGRESVIGLAVMLVAAATAIAADNTGIVNSVLGLLVLLFPVAVGASVRYWAAARGRALDEVKLREREQLARELHDTVAHHVSAITIRAQAGQVVARSDPGAAVAALGVIEQEALRTLSEMRTIVGVLRRGEAAQLAPQQGVADIARLGAGAHGLQVDVTRVGNLDGLTPSLDTALFRIAQESVTNAMRHARHATRVDVRLVGERDCVRMTVQDDGDAASTVRGEGYGMVGMTERATLLGGTLTAGPASGRGWTVDVVLPRTAPA